MCGEQGAMNIRRHDLHRDAEPELKESGEPWSEATKEVITDAKNEGTETVDTVRNRNLACPNRFTPALSPTFS
jgi:hypothetical protein